MGRSWEGCWWLTCTCGWVGAGARIAGVPEYDPLELFKINGQVPLDPGQLFKVAKHIFWLGDTGAGKTHAVCKMLESWAPKVGQMIWVTPWESYASNKQLLDGLVSQVAVVIKEDWELSSRSMSDLM